METFRILLIDYLLAAGLPMALRVALNGLPVVFNVVFCLIELNAVSREAPAAEPAT